MNAATQLLERCKTLAESALDNSEELLNDHLAKYGINYKPQRATAHRSEIEDAKNLLKDIESCLAKQVEQEPHQNRINALKKARDGWHEEATRLARNLHLAQCDLDLLHAVQEKDVWIWQGDGEDHLESMGNRMKVVIFANDLRALTAPQAREPMSDEELDQLTFDCGLSATARDIARAIEAKLNQ